MLLKSNELEDIQKEVETARNVAWDNVRLIEDIGDDDEYKMARDIYSHLLDAYMDLMNAVSLLEALEARK